MDKSYLTVCISMYEADAASIEQKVSKLKELGWSGANRSALIRIAIAKLDDQALTELATQKRGSR